MTPREHADELEKIAHWMLKVVDALRAMPLPAPPIIVEVVVRKEK